MPAVAAFRKEGGKNKKRNILCGKSVDKTIYCGNMNKTRQDKTIDIYGKKKYHNIVSFYEGKVCPNAAGPANLFILRYTLNTVPRAEQHLRLNTATCFLTPTPRGVSRRRYCVQRFSHCLSNTPVIPADPAGHPEDDYVGRTVPRAAWHKQFLNSHLSSCVFLLPSLREVAAKLTEGERRERCRWQMKRPERVAAVGGQRSRLVGKAATGYRNRTNSPCPLGIPLSEGDKEKRKDKRDTEKSKF